MGEMPEQYNLVVNANHASIQTVLKAAQSQEKVKQLYDLALLAQGMLKGKALTDFIQRSVTELQ